MKHQSSVPIRLTSPYPAVLLLAACGETNPPAGKSDAAPAAVASGVARQAG